MPDVTTPGETIHDAFYTILNNAMGNSTTVLEWMPFEGAPQHSIVIQTVSETASRPAIERRTSPTQRGMEKTYWIQISVHNPYGREEARQEADQVDAEIMDAMDTFLSTYGIRKIRLVAGTDQGPSEPLERIAHTILTYECTILADKTD